MMIFGATKDRKHASHRSAPLPPKRLVATGIWLALRAPPPVKMAGDFEQSLNVFKSVTGATAQQMAPLPLGQRELGKDIALPGILRRKMPRSP
jgi:hypothetical protein